MGPILKKPSAWIPIALSLAILAAMLTAVATPGAPAREPDDGTGAHLFQLWLVLEVLMIAFFAIQCLPQAPKQTLLVLAIQMLAVLAACAPVAYFKL